MSLPAQRIQFKHNSTPHTVLYLVLYQLCLVLRPYEVHIKQENATLTWTQSSHVSCMSFRGCLDHACRKIWFISCADTLKLLAKQSQNIAEYFKNKSLLYHHHCTSFNSCFQNFNANEPLFPPLLRQLICRKCNNINTWFCNLVL